MIVVRRECVCGYVAARVLSKWGAQSDDLFHINFNSIYFENVT